MKNFLIVFCAFVGAGGAIVAARIQSTSAPPTVTVPVTVLTAGSPTVPPLPTPAVPLSPTPDAPRRLPPRTLMVKRPPADALPDNTVPDTRLPLDAAENIVTNLHRDVDRKLSALETTTARVRWLTGAAGTISGNSTSADEFRREAKEKTVEARASAERLDATLKETQIRLHRESSRASGDQSQAWLGLISTVEGDRSRVRLLDIPAL